MKDFFKDFFNKHELPFTVGRLFVASCIALLVAVIIKTGWLEAHGIHLPLGVDLGILSAVFVWYLHTDRQLATTGGLVKCLALSALIGTAAGAGMNLLSTLLNIPALFGALTFLTVLVGSRELTDFVQEQMNVGSRISPALQPRPVPARIQGLRSDTPKPPAPRAVLPQSDIVQIETAEQSDGSLSIEINIRCQCSKEAPCGMSTEQIEALRQQLKSVKGTSWKNPESQPDGNQFLQGSITDKADRQEALKEIARKIDGKTS